MDNLIAILRGIRPNEVLAVTEVLIECDIRSIEVTMNSPNHTNSIAEEFNMQSKRGHDIRTIKSSELYQTACITPGNGWCLRALERNLPRQQTNHSILICCRQVSSISELISVVMSDAVELWF